MVGVGSIPTGVSAKRRVMTCCAAGTGLAEWLAGFDWLLPMVLCAFLESTYVSPRLVALRVQSRSIVSR